METALGVALKTVTKRKRTKKTIRVCDHCETPLIWTFAFSYCERFCLNCGAMGGMMGTGKDIPATRDLIFKQKLVDAIWKIIYGRKGMMPSGLFGRSNCEKCRDSHNHRSHASKAELEWDLIARKYLEQIKGLFDGPTPTT